MALMEDDDHDPSVAHSEVAWNELNEGEQSILDAMLTTLTQILALDDGRCEQYALHGLGHLHHPQRHAVVQRFIDEHADEWPEEALDWLKQCRDGTVM